MAGRNPNPNPKRWAEHEGADGWQAAKELYHTITLLCYTKQNSYTQVRGVNLACKPIIIAEISPTITVTPMPAMDQGPTV